MKSSRRIRAAVVGGGTFGECHLKTYSSMAHVDIAGVYTLETDRGEELCEKYGGRLYSSLSDLADDPSIDVVSITTPENDHYQSFKILAERNRGIYVEKPLATSVDEAEEMLVLSRSLVAMCGHCLRFESRIAHIFQQRKSLGRLHHMSFKNRRIRQQKATYGRVHPAYVLLSHNIELANALAGVPFSRVCALESRFSEGQVDGMSILVEYECGATCIIEGGWFLPTQESIVENDHMSLDYDRGTYSIDIPHAGLTFLGPQGSRFINQQYESSVYGMEYGALRQALEYMVDCVARQIQPEISTIEDGCRAVCLASAAIQSATTGQWITRGST